MIFRGAWGASQMSGRGGQRGVHGGRRRRVRALSPGGAARLFGPRGRSFLTACFRRQLGRAVCVFPKARGRGASVSHDHLPLYNSSVTCRNKRSPFQNSLLCVQGLWPCVPGEDAPSFQVGGNSTPALGACLTNKSCWGPMHPQPERVQHGAHGRQVCGCFIRRPRISII